MHNLFPVSDMSFTFLMSFDDQKLLSSLSSFFLSWRCLLWRLSQGHTAVFRRRCCSPPWGGSLLPFIWSRGFPCAALSLAFSFFSLLFLFLFSRCIVTALGLIINWFKFFLLISLPLPVLCTWACYLFSWSSLLCLELFLNQVFILLQSHPELVDVEQLFPQEIQARSCELVTLKTWSVKWAMTVHNLLLYGSVSRHVFIRLVASEFTALWFVRVKLFIRCVFSMRHTRASCVFGVHTFQH